MRLVLMAELLAFGALLAYCFALGFRRKLDPKLASKAMCSWLFVFVLTFAFYDPTAAGGLARLTTRFIVNIAIVVAVLAACWAFVMWWIEKIWPK